MPASARPRSLPLPQVCRGHTRVEEMLVPDVPAAARSRSPSCGCVARTWCRWLQLPAVHREDARISTRGWASSCPLPGYGTCLVAVVPSLADSPLGLCSCHGRPLRARRTARAGDAAASLVESLRAVAASRSRSTTPTSPRFVGGVPPPRRHRAAGRINLLGSAPAGAPRRSSGDLFVHAHRARPHPLAARVDPVAGDHLPRPRRRSLAACPPDSAADPRPLPARSPRRSNTSCDWSTTPPPRPGRRIHRDRPLR